MKWQRGLRAPLMFLGLATTVVSSTSQVTATWWALGTALIAASGWAAAGAERYTARGLLWCVAPFAAWVALSNLAANPSYNPAGLFHPAFLLLAFLVARASRSSEREWLALLLAFAAMLALGSLVHLAASLGEETRARGPFETPAILSASLTLVLVPALVHLFAGFRQRWMLLGPLAVAIGVAAAQSRGGWIGLAAGAIAAAVIARRAGIRIAGRLLAAAATVIATSAVLQLAQHAATPSGDNATAERPLESGHVRLDLYRLTVNALPDASPLVGNGYLSFYYLLEERRAEVPGYRQATTYYAHNDYLQTLYELGVPGLVFLLLLAGVPLAAAWRAAKGVEYGRALALAGYGGAATSMAAHALVDFPYYMPVCLALLGVSLGRMDAALRPAPDAPTPFAPWQRALRAGCAVLVIIALGRPVAAEAAIAYAHWQWRSAQPHNAAYAFEVARRIEPRDWRFHWYAGQFWYAQARVGGGAIAARRAIDAFRAGESANPRQPENARWRSAAQRDLFLLLKDG